MLDIAILRKDLDAVAQRLAARGYSLDADAFRTLEVERKALQVRTESLQAQRNTLSKAIGQARKSGEDVSALMNEVNTLADDLAAVSAENDAVQARVHDWLLTVPNLPHDSVPVGADAGGNVEVRRWSPEGIEPRALGFTPRDHVDVGEPLGLDFASGTKLSGARFAVMRGAIARMHRALAHLMLDIQTVEHGYTECYTPYVVNRDTLTGTGQLPKFEQDLFAVKKGGQEGEGESLYLIPTSEVSLTNLVRGDIVPASGLPMRLTAHTPCFRSEAGS